MPAEATQALCRPFGGGPARKRAGHRSSLPTHGRPAAFRPVSTSEARFLLVQGVARARILGLCRAAELRRTRPVRPPGLPWAAAADAAPKRRRRRSWREIRPAMPAAFRFRHQAAGVLAAPARACRRMGPPQVSKRPAAHAQTPAAVLPETWVPAETAGRLGDPSQWAGFEGRRSARSRSRGRDKLGPSFRSAARAGRAPPGLVCDPCEAGAASVLPRRAPAP